MNLPDRKLAVAIVILLAASGLGACASGPERTECPDGSKVLGDTCHLAPDGTYYGEGPEIPEDVADDVADRIDEEANEESGLYPVEVIEVEVGRD
jgi:hypothetical protein